MHLLGVMESSGIETSRNANKPENDGCATTKTAFCTLEHTMGSAVASMLDEGSDALYVLDDRGSIVGLLTAREIYSAAQKYAYDALAELKVGTLMRA